MASYRVPPTEIWSAGLATHYIVRPLPDSSALRQVIAAVGRRQYGTESSRLTRSLTRYLTQGDESSRLVLLTQGHGQKWMRMENGSWLSLAVDVIRLTYGERSEDALPVRDTGERMVRYTGLLAFRFFVHRGSERKRSESMVATSEYVSVEVLIPEDETEERVGDALRYNFTNAYRDGVEDFSDRGQAPPPETVDAETSTTGDTTSGSGSDAVQRFQAASGDRVVHRWPAGVSWSANRHQDAAADGARDVPESAVDAISAGLPAAFTSASVSTSDSAPQTGGDPESSQETSAEPWTGPAFDSMRRSDRASDPEEPASGQERLDVHMPVGEGFRLWGPTGDAGVEQLAETLIEAGSGSSAFVVVFRPGSGDVDQYRVRNEAGRVVWLDGSSDTEVQPPTDAIHGASFVSGPDGSPWLPPDEKPEPLFEEPPAGKPEPPAETPEPVAERPDERIETAESLAGAAKPLAQPRVEPQEPAESSWHRSQEFPRQLLRERPGALWHYVVDDGGEILLSGTAAEPSGVQPGFARVAGELIWDEESRCWRINDREGWFLDEQARQELENDPQSPYRWLWNIAHRLQEHLGARIEPAQIPPVSSAEDQHESVTIEAAEVATAEPGEAGAAAAGGSATVDAVLAADVDLPLWDSTGDVEIRRLTDTLQNAGPGAKALVVVFRQGHDEVERYRVHNRAGRLVWLVDLTNEETEPPWDATTGASFIWRPDGLPLTS